MPTDYVFFIHGVNTRESASDPTYADHLFDLMQKQAGQQASGPQLRKVALYWGDVARDAEQQLKHTYQQAPTWAQFWFQRTREKLLLQFIGDVVLYISRYVGASIVEALKDQVVQAIAGYRPGDRLHIAGHSLGAVILFDILFSSRWTLPAAPGRESVMQIREAVFGIEPHPGQGIHIGSIHTMGAPLGLFSLMDVDASEQNRPDATHDITPQLQVFLQHLVQVRQGSPLPWYNFAHPGDALAYPLIPQLYDMVDGQRRFLSLQDIIIAPVGLTDRLAGLFRRGMVALIDFRTAHLSYFQSQQVAAGILQAIMESARVSYASDGLPHETPP